MERQESLRASLGAALAAWPDGSSGADRLCAACVELLGVDGAAVSIVDHDASRGTFGSSGPKSRELDELQFTFGEGPCLDAVRTGGPVLVADLHNARAQRWPAFAEKALESGMRAVFALPVSIASLPMAALDLFRYETGPLSDDELMGGLLAAELAAVPVLDLLAEAGGAQRLVDGGDGWDQLTLLDRPEVHQATGMLSVQLDVDVAQALVRLRAYAFAQGRTASEIASDIVNRRVAADPTGTWYAPAGESGTEA